MKRICCKKTAKPRDVVDTAIFVQQCRLRRVGLRYTVESLYVTYVSAAWMIPRTVSHVAHVT